MNFLSFCSMISTFFSYLSIRREALCEVVRDIRSCRPYAEMTPMSFPAPYNLSSKNASGASPDPVERAVV